jgi:hypothetical protein
LIGILGAEEFWEIEGLGGGQIDSPRAFAPSMATFGRIPLCFHCDVRGAIAYCNNSGGFLCDFGIDPARMPREMRK